MRTLNLLSASLLVALYGCQPETPAQQPVIPAAEAPAAPAPAEVPAAMMPAPESVPASVPAETAPAMQGKAAAAPVVKPAPVQAAAAAKVEEAPAVVTAAATAVTAAAAPAKAILSEADAMALARKNGCLVCHSIDKKVVGPAWKDVAAKYRGDAGAEARMMDKIAKGGSGVWGSIAMPPNPKLNEADRQVLARFVLSLK